MCRRGMKELDVLLESFLDANEPDLRAGDWPELERFLECEDDVLWDALKQSGNDPDPAFDNLVSVIRDVRGPGS